jgi:hypothetical protein
LNESPQKNNGECASFFAANIENSDKVKALQQSGNGLTWELQSASIHSRGPVTNQECVFRLVFNPIHIDLETGSIKPSAISDVKDKGCSVDRQTLRSLKDVFEFGIIAAHKKNQNAGPGTPSRSLWGVSEINVSEIREILVGDSKRAFGVYATALAHNLSHADICQLIPEIEKQNARSARAQLFEAAAKKIVRNF